MSCSGYTKVWEMAPEELVGLDGARGTELRVTRGRLWITFEHDTRDVVLEPGDTFVIDRGGLTLMQAHGQTTVCVLGHRLQPRHFPESASRSTRLRRWLAAIAGAGHDRGWAPYA